MIITNNNDVYGDFVIYKNKESILEEPFFSFVISMYNSEETIFDSLNSIFNQTYANFEVILINDGSSDASLNIAFDILKREPRLLIIDQVNIGLTKSLNRAINLANGRFIVRQDADDESSVNRLDEIYKRCSNSDANVFFSKAKEVSEDGMIKSIPSRIYYKDNVFCYRILKYSNVIVHGTLVLRTDVMRQYMYDDAYKYAQDYELLTRLISKKVKFEFLNQDLYFFKKSANSITNTKQKEQHQLANMGVKKNLGHDFLFLDGKSKLIKPLIKIFKGVELIFWRVGIIVRG